MACRTSRPGRTRTLTGLVAVLIQVAALGMLAAGCGPGTDAAAPATRAGAGPAGPTTPGPRATPAAPGSTSSAGGSGLRGAPAAGAPRAASASPYCGPSADVERITVQRWADGKFRISIRPTSQSRHAADPGQAAAQIWQAVQR